MIEIRKVSENATSILLGWDLITGIVGYRFIVDGKVSHTFNPSRTTVRVDKAASHVLVEALGVSDSGTWPSVVPPTQFGADLRPPPPEVPGSYTDVSTRTALLNALAAGNNKLRLTQSITGDLELTRRSANMWEVAFAPNVFVNGRILLSGTRGCRLTDARARGGHDGIKGDGSSQSVDMTHLVRPFAVDAVNIGISFQRASSDLWIDSPYTLRCGLTSSEPPNQRHGMYLEHTARWQITNHLAEDCQAFGFQAYPGPSDGLYTGWTIRGGVSRGGPVFQVSGPTQAVGGVVERSPSEASVIYGGGVTVFDTIATQGVFEGQTYTHCKTNAQVSERKGWVQPARYGLLPPTFRDGSPRVTADAGSES